MNIVRFNEEFERPIIRDWGRKDWREWSTSPLFNYPVDFSDVLNKADELAARQTTELPPFPFRQFRLAADTLYFADDKHVVGRVPTKMFIRSSEPNRIEMLVWAKTPREVLRRLHGSNKQTAVMHVQYSGGFPECEIGVRLYDTVNDKWVTTTGELLSTYEIHNAIGEKGDVDTVKKTALQYVFIVLGFAMDAMAPTNRIATVEPTRDEPRSVEWVKARTHYTIIAHDHPANNKEVRKGQRVKVDEQEEIRRMAHARRAHYKTLRHPRYRFARGQRIFVRATWVGPKEWQDEGGRQIYKILELADQEVAA